MGGEAAQTASAPTVAGVTTENFARAWAECADAGISQVCKLSTRLECGKFKEHKNPYVLVDEARKRLYSIRDGLSLQLNSRPPGGLVSVLINSRLSELAGVQLFVVSE